MRELSDETVEASAYYLTRMVQRLEVLTEIVDPHGIHPDRQVWERVFDEVRDVVAILRKDT